MMKKFSITLLVAIFSLLIIGFGGAAKAEAAGECTETQLANGASESTAFTNCRAYEADAARYAAISAFYTSEASNVQRAFEADAARYSALAAFFTNETGNNAQRAFEANVARYTGLAALYGTTCLGAGSADMTTMALVGCMSDSAYQAANPELMLVSHFAGVVANEEVTGSAFFAKNPELMVSRRLVVADGGCDRRGCLCQYCGPAAAQQFWLLQSDPLRSLSINNF